MTKKIILDLCGGSGAWSKPYADAGFIVINITLPEFDVSSCCFSFKHLIFKNLFIKINEIHGVLAAPPCTKFSKAAWKIKKADRDFEEGMKTVRFCLEIIWGIQERGAPLKFWALENPMGYLNRFLGHPAFYFQPWMFGDDSPLRTKRTYLWGYFNPPAKTKLKRDFPFISPHTSKRDSVPKEKENKGWYKMNAAQRAQTPAAFASAFFKANQ